MPPKSPPLSSSSSSSLRLPAPLLAIFVSSLALSMSAAAAAPAPAPSSAPAAAVVLAPSYASKVEKERIKNEVTNKLAEVLTLYSLIRPPGGEGLSVQPQQQRVLLPPPPYINSDVRPPTPVYLDSSGEVAYARPAAAAPVVAASTYQAPAIALPDADRYVWKKSGAAGGGETSKQIHFHPCYFNAVSCF